MKKRKICVVTSSRADYGPLLPLLQEIKKDKGLELQLVVTGSHLLKAFGYTYKEIEKDGFKIAEKLPVLRFGDTSEGLVKSMGLVSTLFAGVFKRLQPDLVLVLGDRFEMLNVVSSALIFCIPVVHVCGGELTEGAFDDSIRHAITKMSHIHLTATDEYRRRVIQIGEDPTFVFNIGEIGLDNISRIEFLTRDELEKTLKIKFNKKNILVTFHPVTLEKDELEAQFKNLLKVLAELKDTTIIFTKCNADTGGSKINKMMDLFAANKSNVYSFASLGQQKYLSLMQNVDAIVGNSSSGIIEAPSFKVATINIGNRQKGRIMAKSIINCDPEYSSIKNAFDELYSNPFKESLKEIVNPYVKKNSAISAKEIIKKIDLTDITKKKFYNIDLKIIKGD